MKLTIKITMDNAAFERDPAGECARILQRFIDNTLEGWPGHNDWKVNATHTPTPWKVSGCMSGNNVLIEHGDSDTLSPIVCEVSSDGGRLPTRANAEFIVRACNAHDELVAALQCAISRDPSHWEDIARAALAKAKGENRTVVFRDCVIEGTEDSQFSKLAYETWRDEQIDTLRKLYQQKFGSQPGNSAMEFKAALPYQSFPDFCRQQWEKGAK